MEAIKTNHHTTVRLILGDQLNMQHSWYDETSDDILYFMAEMRQETDYVTHHIQKVVGFFTSMRWFADALQQKGHKVIYFALDHPEITQNLEKNIKYLLEKYNAQCFEYQLPDEYRLDQQLVSICDNLSMQSKAYDTEHFLTSRSELAAFYENKKQYKMEYFYRYMRKKHDILIVANNQPEGGTWNFDHNNRNKWKGDTLIPPPKVFTKDVSSIVELLEQNGVKTLGSLDPKHFEWPTSREEALEVLDYFCKHLLVQFGDFQDAMDPDQYYLYHSRLSFALNIKLIGPKEVIDTVLMYWRENSKEIEISQVEGFVRQILGWREYMRGMYWLEMPEFAQLNELKNHNPLPAFYWNGKTKMNCMAKSIRQSLDTAYAHHIQRLMVTGNYALLTQCDPDEVDTWYLGIYIDAIEWVEITNTRGMSQWADGGKIATKPYVSSGSYIHKMSNYCKGCYYSPTQKTGEKACPFNSLYWNFIDEKKEYFQHNPRMTMMLHLLSKMSPALLAQHKERAQAIISNPNDY